MALPFSHLPVLVGSQTFELSHLTAFAALIPGKGLAQGSDLGVVVVFSNHVFTERTKHADPHHVLDHHGTRRSLDPVRYAMSKRLPSVLATALAANHLTFVSRSFGGTDNLILLEMENGRTWSVVFCFEPIAGGVRMEVLSAHPKVVDQAKIARKPLSYFARTCLFQQIRIPKT